MYIRNDPQIRQVVLFTLAYTSCTFYTKFVFYYTYKDIDKDKTIFLRVLKLKDLKVNLKI